MEKKENSAAERREYIRLDTVFPVSFRLRSMEGEKFLSEELQGFTNNVGKGGICLMINNLKPALVKLIREKAAKVSLNIELPLAGKRIPALARASWITDIAGEPDKHLIGLRYEQIDRAENAGLMRYARSKKLFVPVVLAVIILLGMGFTVNSYINMKLVKGNRELVRQLVGILQESSAAKQKIKEIAKEREALQLKMEALRERIQAAEEQKANLAANSKIQETEAAGKLSELITLAAALNKDKISLQEQLIGLQNKEGIVTQELLRLDKKKTSLEKANLDKMYLWLKVHQNPTSGLVISFEGDSDISGWAFLYDQALIMQAYTYFSDFERVKKILDFFDKKAEKKDGLFFNAYYATDGKPAEYTVHSGPNIWLGIAILQYTKKANDSQYLKLAQDIAQRIMSLQNSDKDGSILGGPGVEWISTEHNLDAYAFFSMLHKITGNAQYQDMAAKILNWLLKYTYDSKDIPIKRGKGDSTIATDTYAWSIASLGPEKLEELGMNPDRILEFAEQSCSVEVFYLRPEGQTVKIKGFDFAPQRNISRGGVVSSEWTAQMVIAFKMTAEYYYKKGLKAKAHAYDMKADEYLSSLGNMIISSPSPSGQGETCLPYATQELADTGHGWVTPRGKSTGSLAGTAYTLFAYYNYNPLVLKE